MSFSGRGRTRSVGFLGTCLLSFVFLTAGVAKGQGTAVLFLSPSSGHYTAGADFSVTVQVDTAGNTINAAEGTITFDPSILEVRSLGTSGSVFTLWPGAPTFSNEAGTVQFAGGLPSPGYHGANGKVLAIQFHTKASIDTTAVVVTSGSILANDGQATNVLGSLGRVSYAIGPMGTPTAIAAGVAPSIHSSSHPSQTKWYNHADASFAWSVPSGVQEVWLVLGQRADSVPRVRYVPPIDHKELLDLADGAWYFNAQFRTAQGLGPVASFRFNIDTHQPEAFTAVRSAVTDPTDPRPNIILSATDKTSGIDHYELTIGTDAPITVPGDQTGKPYALVAQLPGTREVLAKAFDAAGNVATTSFSFTVAPITPPTITAFPVVASAAPFAVSGHGIPGTHVRLYAVSEGSSIPPLTDTNDTNGQVGTTLVDDGGNWTTSVDMKNSGRYGLYAYSQDDRGALSVPSNIVQVREGGGFVSVSIDFLRHLAKSTWFRCLLLTALLMLLTAYIVRGLRTPTKKRKKESKKLASKLDIMLQDIEDELLFLEKMNRGRPLYPEERYLKSKLVQYRKTLRQVSDDTHSRLAKKK